jgi:hypothetical protein
MGEAVLKVGTRVEHIETRLRGRIVAVRDDGRVLMAAWKGRGFIEALPGAFTSQRYVASRQPRASTSFSKQEVELLDHIIKQSWRQPGATVVHNPAFGKLARKVQVMRAKIARLVVDAGAKT